MHLCCDDCQQIKSENEFTQDHAFAIIHGDICDDCYCQPAESNFVNNPNTVDFWQMTPKCSVPQDLDFDPDGAIKPYPMQKSVAEAVQKIMANWTGNFFIASEPRPSRLDPSVYEFVISENKPIEYIEIKFTIDPQPFKPYSFIENKVEIRDEALESAYWSRS